MIVRVVRLEFRAEETANFERLFADRQTRIQAVEGCRQVVLWRDANASSVYYTYSQWDSLEHLEAYRHSAFFEETWRLTKALFAAKAQAFSALPL